MESPPHIRLSPGSGRYLPGEAVEQAIQVSCGSPCRYFLPKGRVIFPCLSRCTTTLPPGPAYLIAFSIKMENQLPQAVCIACDKCAGRHLKGKGKPDWRLPTHQMTLPPEKSGELKSSSSMCSSDAGHPAS